MPDLATSALLELDGLTKRFGKVVVADGLSLRVGPGDIVGIVGPNGAGKTSLFGLIAGDLEPGSGEIRFDGARVTRMDAAARCRLGIGRTFQVPRPFGGMSVFENTVAAAQQGAGLRGRRSHAHAAHVLERTGLIREANTPAGRLGLLPRKRLELARALATQPRLLLLDEVAGGLTDPEVGELVEIVRATRAEGVAVVWIEHVVRALTAAVERLICLAAGRFVGDGRPAEVLADPAVREVFLGAEVTTELAAGPPAPDGSGRSGADKREDADDHRAGAGGYQDDAGGYQDDAGGHRDDAGRHQDDAGDHQDDAGDHQDDAGRHRDDAGRHRDDAGDRRDDAGAG